MEIDLNQQQNNLKKSMTSVIAEEVEDSEDSFSMGMEENIGSMNDENFKEKTLFEKYSALGSLTKNFLGNKSWNAIE